MKSTPQAPQLASQAPDDLAWMKRIEAALSAGEPATYDDLEEGLRYLLAENTDLKRAAREAGSRASWLERQEYILVMKWSNGVRSIKTSIYGRERNLIAEGETFALAVTNAVQADADRLQKLVH